jgi:hypothetical protein
MSQDIIRTALTRFRTLVESNDHQLRLHGSTLKADRQLARLALKKYNKHIELNQSLNTLQAPHNERETQC